jgi:arsenate reductase-like glutaredoxin family protein
MGLLFCISKNLEEFKRSPSTDCADINELMYEFLLKHVDIHNIDMDHFVRYDPYEDTELTRNDIEELYKVSSEMVEVLSNAETQERLNAVLQGDYFTINELLKEVQNLNDISRRALNDEDKTIVVIGD